METWQLAVIVLLLLSFIFLVGCFLFCYLPWRANKRKAKAATKFVPPPPKDEHPEFDAEFMDIYGKSGHGDVHSQGVNPMYRDLEMGRYEDYSVDERIDAEERKRRQEEEIYEKKYKPSSNSPYFDKTHEVSIRRDSKLH